MSEQRSATVPAEDAGDRLDRVLVRLFPDYSRTRLQQWVRAGQVWLDGVQRQPKHRVHGGERVVVQLSEESHSDFRPQAIQLDIVYEDSSLLVVNKAAGMVVHPAAGNPDGTLVNALLYHAPELAELPRAGLVHRLDKDTTGLLVVARSPSAYKYLVEQLHDRAFQREYQAVVVGVMPAGGTVNEPIARHPVERKRMSVWISGKPALTQYRVKQRFRAHTHLRVRLETGRTHQIRVHLAHIHYPIVGDPVYGGRLRLPQHATDELVKALRNFRRQALHAYRLGLVHPESGDWKQWEAPLPQDLHALVQAMQDDAGHP